MTRLEDSMAFKVLETEAERDRLRYLWRTATLFYPEEVMEIFISETRDEAGREVIDSVWFFTPSLVGEFKGPMQQDDFDAVALSDLNYVNVTKKDFDFSDGKTTPESRMTLYMDLGQVSGTLRASSSNCGELLRIVKGLLLPRIAAR